LKYGSGLNLPGSFYGFHLLWNFVLDLKTVDKSNYEVEVLDVFGYHLLFFPEISVN